METNRYKEYEMTYTQNQVALMLDVHRDTITYWEKNNLIPKAQRDPKNNYRKYTLEDVYEIARIRGIGMVDTGAIARVKEQQREERRKMRSQKKQMSE